MEVGYMKGDPDGWQAVLWHVNGPNERLANAQSISFLDNFPITAVTNPLIPTAVDSLNELKMSSFELNKVWRLKPFHNGTIMEPIIGYRYMNVRDYFQRQNMTELLPPAPAPQVEFFQVNTLATTFENNMPMSSLSV